MVRNAAFLCTMALGVGFFLFGIIQHAIAAGTDSLTASVRIIVPTTTTPETTSSGLQPGYSPAPVVPVDQTAPLFIPPSDEQKKTGTFFDDTGKIQFTKKQHAEVDMEWYSDEDVSFVFVYGLTPNYEMANFSNISFAQVRHVRLIALIRETQYYYKITITDRSGNSSTYASSFFWEGPSEPEPEESLEEETKPNEPKETEEEPLTEEPGPAKEEEAPEKKSFIEEVKKAVEDVFAEEQLSEQELDSPPSSESGKKEEIVLFPGGETTEEKNDGQDGQEQVDYSVVGSEKPERLTIGAVSKKIERALSAFHIEKMQSSFPQLRLVRDVMQAVAIPGPKVFLMPSVINRGFNTVVILAAAARQAVFADSDLCHLVGVDGPLESVVYLSLQFLLCK